jgi:hypothetical protein
MPKSSAVFYLGLSGHGRPENRTNGARTGLGMAAAASAITCRKYLHRLRRDTTRASSAYWITALTATAKISSGTPMAQRRSGWHRGHRCRIAPVQQNDRRRAMPAQSERALNDCQVQSVRYR